MKQTLLRLVALLCALSMLSVLLISCTTTTPPTEDPDNSTQAPPSNDGNTNQTPPDDGNNDQTPPDDGNNDQTPPDDDPPVTDEEATVIELLTEAKALFDTAGVAFSKTAGDITIGGVTPVAYFSERIPTIMLLSKGEGDDVPKVGPTLDNLEGLVLMCVAAGYLSSSGDGLTYDYVLERFRAVDAAYLAAGGTGRVTAEGGGYYEKTADGKGYIIGNPITLGDIGETEDKNTIIAYGETSVSVDGNSVIFSNTVTYKDITPGYEDVLTSYPVEPVVITVDGNKAQRTDADSRVAIVKTETEIFIEAYVDAFSDAMLITSPLYIEGLAEQWMNYVDNARNEDMYGVPDEPYLVCRLASDGSSGEMKCFRNYSHDVSGPDANGNPVLHRGQPLPTSWLESFDPETVMNLEDMEHPNWINFKKIYTCTFHYEKQETGGDGKEDPPPPIEEVAWPTDSEVSPFGITYLPQLSGYEILLYKTYNDTETMPELASMGIDKQLVLAMRGSAITFDTLAAYAETLYAAGYTMNADKAVAELSTLITRADDYFTFNAFMVGENSLYAVQLYGTTDGLYTITLQYTDTTPDENTSTQPHTCTDENADLECDICYSNYTTELRTALPTDAAWLAITGQPMTDVIAHLAERSADVISVTTYNSTLLRALSVELEDQTPAEIQALMSLLFAAGYTYGYDDDDDTKLVEVTDVAGLITAGDDFFFEAIRVTDDGSHYSVHINYMLDGENAVPIYLWLEAGSYLYTDAVSVDQIPASLYEYLKLDTIGFDELTLTPEEGGLYFTDRSLFLDPLVVPEGMTEQEYFDMLVAHFYEKGVAINIETGIKSDDPTELVQNGTYFVAGYGEGECVYVSGAEPLPLYLGVFIIANGDNSVSVAISLNFCIQ